MPSGLLNGALQLDRVDAVGDAVEAEADAALAEQRFAAEVARRELEVLTSTLTTTAWPRWTAPLRGETNSTSGSPGTWYSAASEEAPQPQAPTATARTAPKAARSSVCPACGPEHYVLLAAPMSPAYELAYRIGAAARRPATWLQLLKFGLVGGSGYLINLAVFAVLSGNLGVHHTVAAVGAFCVAVTSNFLFNRHWTFGAGRRPRRLPGDPLLRGQHRRPA